MKKEKSIEPFAFDTNYINILFASGSLNCIPKIGQDDRRWLAIDTFKIKELIENDRR